MTGGDDAGGPFEAVRPYPYRDGGATVARHARTAARYGYDGIVVRAAGPPGDGRQGNDDDRGDSDGDDDRGGDAGGSAGTDDPWAGYGPDAVADRYGIDVVPAVEVGAAADPERAGGAVGSRRTDVPVVIVRGGSRAAARVAVENELVDVLTRPSAGDGGFDAGLAKSAAANGVRVEFDLGPALRAAGGDRVDGLRDLRRLREVVANYDVPFVVSATPASHLDLRAPRDLAAVGRAVGFDPDRTRAGLREWGAIARRNRERLSGAFIAPGVKRGSHDTDG